MNIINAIIDSTEDPIFFPFKYSSYSNYTLMSNRNN